MVFLLLAIISSALVSVIMRLSNEKVKANLGLLTMNYLTALCLSIITGNTENVFAPEPGLYGAMLMGAINGILYLSSFVLFQTNVRKNGIVLSTVFMKLGILVPIITAVCFFSEVPEFLQALGFCIAIVAIVLINLEKDDSAMQFKAGLPLLLILSGLADGMANIFEELGRIEMSTQFFLCTFIVASSLCAILTYSKKQRIGKWEILFGCILGIPNFMSARFMLMALEHLPAVIVYPSYSVATILLVTLAGVGFFREKLGRRQWFAMAMILVSIIMLNI